VFVNSYELRLFVSATSPALSSRPGFPVTLHQTDPRVRLSVKKGACT
jgi:hypothetical protein